MKKKITKQESVLLPILVKLLKKHGKRNPIKAPDIALYMTDRKYELGFNTQFPESSLRKYAAIIRGSGMLPLIASRRGYYISYNDNEIRNAMVSMNERGHKIMKAARGMGKFL